MNLVDSSAWLEYLADGPGADAFESSSLINSGMATMNGGSATSSGHPNSHLPRRSVISIQEL